MSPNSSQPATPVDHQGDMLARLQRLEDIVLRNRGSTEQRGAPDGSSMRAQSDIPEGEGDAKWLEGVGAPGTSAVSLL